MPARRRWTLSLLAALGAGLVGWLLLSAAGASGVPRLLPLLVALAGWALWNRRVDGEERAANARLVEDLAAAGDPELRASLDELDIVHRRMDAVLARLRTQRFGAGWGSRWGGRYLYQLPWYLVIGAPGSGKTTALAASRLGAPLADGGEAQPIANLGGTRQCDWWFTDHAVLIDTAGRYTTQDSRRAVDGRVWSGLLDLVKAHRPRQPINGAIVTVCLPDLAAWTVGERQAHALALRQRLNELHAQLGQRVPVYLLGTKADLLEGFTTFFDPLDSTERSQVWGLTLPAGQAPGDLPATVRALFSGLVRRLDDRLLERLHQEPDIRRRTAVFALPQRVAGLEPALAELAQIVFTAPPGEEPPLLRGIYLTSATQAGTLPATALEDPPRPYFLDRLLPELVFPEANLAEVDRRLEQERRRRARLSAGGALAATLALALFWLNSHAGNSALLARADAAVGQVEALVKTLDTPPRSLSRVDDTDMAAILPVLDALRSLPAGHAERGSWPAVTLTGGLHQGERLAGPAEEAYRRALRSLFLARIVLRLEEQLRTNWARPDQLRLALRAYRMMGGQDPLDRAFLAEWLALDWQRTLPGPANDERRRALGDHLATLFEVGFAPIPADELLLSRVAEVLAQADQPKGPVRAAP
ncbi:type VI secretion system membrane subunit TssM [Azospirillum thermophilum]|uniref:Type VI secretion system membrane subunit TssM n=2 Tax=Azospirillum thermophilum TaxID=2202148 RepID=A0A2S2CTT9_9PROT|nr:type VI secretion system membrane subunit TssM [Azospirillum thermophilum]